jgi:hypothetical protein
MDGYYAVEDGRVVWRFFRDCWPDIVPEEIQTQRGIFPVARSDRPGHNESVRLPDVGRSVKACVQNG